MEKAWKANSYQFSGKIFLTGAICATTAAYIQENSGFLCSDNVFPAKWGSQRFDTLPTLEYHAPPLQEVAVFQGRV